MKKKFKVPALVTTRCYVIIEADSAEEAQELAEELDGGDFVSEDEGDFKILEDEISETNEDLT